MPQLTVNDQPPVEVPAGKRLVKALEDEANLDQLHACGGVGKCTTCQVTFRAGEPDKMTKQEKETLTARELTGVRLSCQITCEHDMSVTAESTLSTSDRKDVGGAVADEIQPEPEWVEK